MTISNETHSNKNMQKPINSNFKTIARVLAQISAEQQGVEGTCSCHNDEYGDRSASIDCFMSSGCINALL